MSNNPYIKTAKSLKKMGLVNYDLRKELTPAQKSQITKLSKSIPKEFIKHPESVKLLTPNKSQKEKMNKSGFTSVKGKMLIPLNGNKRVQLTSKGLTYTGYSAEGKKLTTRTELVKFEKFHQSFFDVLGKPIKSNQVVTAQIGNNSPFNARYQSYEELLHYLEHEFRSNSATSTKDLMRYISIVTIDQPILKVKKQSAKTKGTPVKSKRTKTNRSY